MSTPSDEVLSWTNQDPRESLLFNSWGVVYRFQTTLAVNGSSVTNVWRTVRANKEDRVAKLEWGTNGGLGRVVIGKHTVPMADLVRPDTRITGARVFNGLDGAQYRWRPGNNGSEVLLQDSSGAVIAFYQPTRPTRYQIGDVYGEIHFVKNAGAGTVMHPPVMDIVIVTCFLYRFCALFGL